MTKLILASGSERRVRLLKQINIKPDEVISPDIDEAPLRGELAPKLAKRLAIAKAEKVLGEISEKNGDFVLIAADTVAVKGRLILPKARDEEEVRYCLGKISGSRHRVYTGVTVARKQQGVITKQSKLVCTILKFKRLSYKEIEIYTKLGEGVGKAGGYHIDGVAGSFVSFISGSYSNILGLPLYETSVMLAPFYKNDQY